jgi:hypothetical protein
MAQQLWGGTLNELEFADSMAEEIEKALDEVRAEAGLPPLPHPMTTSDDAVRKDRDSRRILFIAIARGVLRHLQLKQDAFAVKVKVPPHNAVTAHATIDVREP